MTHKLINFNRFGKYFVSDLKSAAASCGWSVVVLVSLEIAASLIVGFFSLLFTQGHEWVSLGLAFRSTCAFAVLVGITVAAGGKCYGSITGKLSGTRFLMVPATSFEKTVSMVLVSCLIVPLVTLCGFLLMDGVLCLVDSGCGRSLLSYGTELFSLKIGESFNFSDITDPVELALANSIAGSVTRLVNPLLYIDDMMQVAMTFLLGAIYFKKNKIAKTILVMMLFGMAMSTVLSPIILAYLSHLHNIDIESLAAPLTWVLSHAALVDTLNDTLVNAALFVAIYFRVKKMQH